MNFQKLVVVAVLWIWMSMQVFAQSVQTLRGTIVDDVTQSPLIGANIVIQNFEPLTGTVTDENGNFKFENLAVGSYSLKVSYLGYKEIILSNINLGSGKEVVLSIPMTEDVASTEEVVIKAQIDKGKPLNALATVSTRTFR